MNSRLIVANLYHSLWNIYLCRKSRTENSPWMLAGIAYEGKSFRIHGLDVWQSDWKRDSDEIVTVSDPMYHEPKKLSINVMTDGKKTIRFAAGEFSNGVWGFYISHHEA